MIRRYFATVAVAVAALIGLSSMAGTAQDNYEERIEDLETRVALLETAIVDEGSQQPGIENGVQYTIVGTVVPTGEIEEAFLKMGDGCFGLNDFNDFHVEAVVRVRDHNDQIIGRGLLYEAANAEDDECRFTFEVAVPEADSYSFEFGEGRGDSISFAFEQLEAQGWEVNLTVG